MRIYRLCRASYPPYDGEGARRAGGRWNSKGVRVVYMSENRSLAVLEILAHLSDVLPDKYVLGSADLPDYVSPEILPDKELPRIGQLWWSENSIRLGNWVIIGISAETRLCWLFPQ
jgi:hypothetical protein